jgi:hypothetical protein
MLKWRSPILLLQGFRLEKQKKSALWQTQTPSFYRETLIFNPSHVYCLYPRYVPRRNDYLYCLTRFR